METEKESDWLLLDMSYLGYKALYSTGQLKYEGNPTGVLFGIFQDIQTFQDQFATNKICYCFDSQTAAQFRELYFIDYKKTRKEKHLLATSKERKARREMKDQLIALRTNILPKQLGLRNVFHQPGYEADDLIAILCQKLNKEPRVIISADEDMYQLLNEYTTLYNPQKKQPYTQRSLFEEYAISPADWVTVKSIAGCSTDDIPGVRGVGEKTAAQYIVNNMSKNFKPKTATDEKIKDFLGTKDFERNLMLTKLPWGPAKLIPPMEEEINIKKFNEILTAYGIKPKRTPVSPGGFFLKGVK